LSARTIFGIFFCTLGKAEIFTFIIIWYVYRKIPDYNLVFRLR